MFALLYVIQLRTGQDSRLHGAEGGGVLPAQEGGGSLRETRLHQEDGKSKHDQSHLRLHLALWPWGWGKR